MEEGNYYSQIYFHFQQSAEKYLKVFIIYSNLEFRKILNLLELLGQCASVDSSFKEIEKECKFLNPFYIITRYPLVENIEVSRDVVYKAMESVRKIKEFVNAKLSD